MMNIKHILIASALMVTWGSYGQSNLTMYNFNALPQTLHTNPAYPQQATFWIGLPVASRIDVQYQNTGFKLADLLADREGEIGDLTGDNVYDINDNIDDIIANLDDKSQFAFSSSFDLINIGFKTKKGFVTIGANQQVDYLMDYPADLMRLLWNGNQQFVGNEFTMREFDFETIARTNFYLGYQRRFLNDKLILGTRLKYILGQANAYVERFNLTNAQPNNATWDISSDVLIRTGGLGTLTDARAEVTDFAFSSNTGFAVDLGAYYQVNDKLNVSASFLDWGSITWEEGTRDYMSEGQYTFNGLNVDFSDDDADPVQETLDSLESALNISDEGGNSYKRNLIQQFYASANYELTEKHAFGLMYHARFWDGTMLHDVGVNYVSRLSRMFQYTASYSIVNGTKNNLGGGIQLKLGPLQIYVVSDNILGALTYDQLESTNLSAGINLTFIESRKKIKARKEAEKKKAEEIKKNNQQEQQEKKQEEEAEKK